MRMFISLFVATIISFSSFGQQSIPKPVIPADRIVDNQAYHDLRKSNQHQQEAGMRSSVTFEIDYDAADEFNAAEIGGEYNRFIWPVNRDFQTDEQNDDDHFTMRWAAVTFRDLYDYVTETTYPYNISTVTVDTVFAAINHQNESGSDDTIKVSIIELTSSPSGLASQDGIFLTNPVLWDTMLITNQSISTSSTSLSLLAVPAGLTLPQNTKFGVLIEYFGPKEDEFNVLAGYNDNCNDDCAAFPPLFEDNSWYYHNVAVSQSGQPPFTVINGINQLILDCNQNGQFEPELCEMFYIQNWSIWTQVTLDVQYAVQASADKEAVCPGEFVSLSADVFGGASPFSFQWSGDGIVGADDQQTITVEPTQNTTYTVVVTDDNGEVETSEVTVQVNGIDVSLTVSGGSTTIACGATVNLAASASGNTQGVSYQWRRNNVVQTDVTGSQYQNVGIGEYRVTVTNATGCTATQTVTIDDGEAQDADFEWTTPAIEQTPVQFTNTSVETTGWNWSWDFGDGTGNTSTSENPSYTYPNFGTYVVTLTATKQGEPDCIRTRNRSVEVQSANSIANIEEHGVNVNFFPNPSNGELTLELGQFDGIDVSVNISSLDGRSVYENAYRNVNDLKTDIKLNNVSNGVYMITVETENNAFSSKLLIVK